MDDEQATVVDKKEVNIQTHLLIKKEKKTTKLSKEVVAMLLEDDADRY